MHASHPASDPCHRQGFAGDGFGGAVICFPEVVSERVVGPLGDAAEDVRDAGVAKESFFFAGITLGAELVPFAGLDDFPASKTFHPVGIVKIQEGGTCSCPVNDDKGEIVRFVRAHGYFCFFQPYPFFPVVFFCTWAKRSSVITDGTGLPTVVMAGLPLIW